MRRKQKKGRKPTCITNTHTPPNPHPTTSLSSLASRLSCHFYCYDSPNLIPPHSSFVLSTRPRLVRMGIVRAVGRVAAATWRMQLLLLLLFFLFCVNENGCCGLGVQMVHSLHHKKMEVKNTLLPYFPSSSPQPFVPLLAPSPLPPFANNSLPRLSGSCALNFSSIDDMLSTTALDCSAAFAPFLANVICCPQLQATLLILVGQSSKDTGLLGLDAFHANHCLSDVQQILGSQGANEDLQNVCSIQPLNLAVSSCPVTGINGFESVVDSSKLLAACKKVDSVNECCSQICQNAILEAARKLSHEDGLLPNKEDAGLLPEHSSRIEDCRSVVLRWLASRLDSLSSKQVFRQISNCNINKVCPLVFPDPKNVAKYCGDEIKNKTLCCHSINKYVSHLQKQSFITNLQALNCAALLGLQLQKINVTDNVYSLCRITLKQFSVQVGSQESGCLLPSLPSDVTFDQSAGISFTCDLNDNIAAPWPTTSEVPSSCNKSGVNLPSFPAATSSEMGIINYNSKALVLALSLSFLL